MNHIAYFSGNRCPFISTLHTGNRGSIASFCMFVWVVISLPALETIFFHNDYWLKLVEGEWVSHKDSYGKAAHKNMKIC